MKVASVFNPSDGGDKRNESEHSALKKTVSEYVQKSSIHGLAYVGDSQRNKFERICWFVMFLCSVSGASYLIYQSYWIMKQNPIIESPSLSRTPMREVPFPAVTFCPAVEGVLSPVGLDKANWPDFAHDLFPDIITVLTDEIIVIPNLLIFETLFLRRSDQNNYDILTQVLPEIEIFDATFGSFSKEVEVSLQKTITEFGPCVTFNMFQEKDILSDGAILSSLDDAINQTGRLWSRDSGFIKNLPLANYANPFRSFGPGDSFAMSFNVNDSQRFSSFGSEFYVTLHAPDEVPLFGRHSDIISVVPGKHNTIEITAHLVVSEGIEHYDPEVRQCYYSNERHLKFYKNYTQNHCETECLANYTLAQCGCISYQLPHFNDTKLCSTEFECIDNASVNFFLTNFNDDAERAPVDDCNCLPPCTQLTYEAVRTSTIAGQTTGTNDTSILIINKYPYIKKHVRTELHSISEFFANCGGSLGLFLGVTVFSIVELLYFCTFRFYSHSTRRLTDSNE